MNSRRSGAILICGGDDHLCHSRFEAELRQDAEGNYLGVNTLVTIRIARACCDPILRMILEPAPAPQPVRKGRLRRLPGAELQKRTYVATDDDNTGETVYVRG